jgi:hypothetical protein
MPLNMDDLPVLESAGPLGRRAPRDAPAADAYGALRLSRRRPIDLLAMAVERRFIRLPEGVSPRDIFPAPTGAKYSTHSGCGGYNYDASCNEACFGFAPHHMDPFYCATCDEQAADPVNNPSWNWHFVGSRGSIQYQDREPDVCAGKDAWKWKVGACGSCTTSAVFRCHDGWKKYPGASSWDPTICQGIVSCDNVLKLC